MVEIDIKGFFDNIDHALLLKAVRHHTRERWVVMYIERWLRAPVQMPDGTIQQREKGTPQGGVISPLLANLFLHYAFDMWMRRHHGDVPFERYADDAVCHCRSQARAQSLIGQLRERFVQCGLELHPQKTRVVFCKDSNRRGDYPDTMVLWATHKFKRLRGRRRRASHWLARIARRNPQLFAHWPLLWEQASMGRAG